jgi:endonuclease/exonuclease/phosphatase (EEP) superfamily protein YafD
VAEWYALQSDGDGINAFRPRGFLLLPLLISPNTAAARGDNASTPRQILLATSHTNAGPNLKDDAGRKVQALQVLERVRKTAAALSIEDVVLVGDFNAQSHTPSVLSVAEAGYQDAWVSSGPSSPGFTWDNKNPICAAGYRRIPDERVDYIWSKGQHVRAAQCKLAMNHAPYTSDHFGVWANFEIQ